jgi:hypothetical protein
MVNNETFKVKLEPLQDRGFDDDALMITHKKLTDAII